MADGGRTSWIRRVAWAVAAAVGGTALAVSGSGAPVAATTPIVAHLDLDMAVVDAIADPVRPVFYSSTAADSPTSPAEIVVIDRRTAQVVDTHVIDGQPGSLGIADDGSALYVGNNTTGALQKRSLPDFALEWKVTPERRNSRRVDVPEDIEVSPVDPDLVVVSYRTPGVSPAHAGVFVATEGRVLPDRTPAHTGPNRIEFTDDPNRLVGYYSNSSSFSFWHLDIDEDGVERTENPESVTLGYATDIRYVDGVVVSSVGHVIEPGPPAAVIDEFPPPIDLRNADSMAIDDDAGLVYWMETQPSANTFLSVHDLTTRERVEYFDVPEAGWSYREPLRYVGGGLLLFIRDSQTLLLFPQSVPDFVPDPNPVPEPEPDPEPPAPEPDPLPQPDPLPVPDPDPAPEPVDDSFGEFTPLPPTRIVDTRTGLGQRNGRLGPGETFEFQVAGEGGVPGANVIAAVLNVTAVNPSDGGYFTVFPTGIRRPVISNVNFPAGRTVPNLVTATVGQGGRVSVFNATGDVHLVVDVAGFYAGEEGVQGARYEAATPQRIADTRTGQGLNFAAPIGVDSSLRVPVAGRAGVPLDAVAAVLNVTATNATEPSFITVSPFGGQRPTASNLNFGPGGATANQVIVGLPSTGWVDVYNSAGRTDVIVDVVGYYLLDDIGLPGRFVPVEPYRFVDTREQDLLPAPGWMQSGDQIYVDDDDLLESAIVANLTVTGGQGGGYVVAHPYPGQPPETSSINYVSGQTVANHAIVPVDPSFAFMNRDGRTHLIVDIFGFFT
ncbi:MAG: hypothetical protein AAGD33_19455 [Actinomycetota bacterium]